MYGEPDDEELAAEEQEASLKVSGGWTNPMGLTSHKLDETLSE
jgi:hypothetical protein